MASILEANKISEENANLGSLEGTVSDNDSRLEVRIIGVGRTGGNAISRIHEKQNSNIQHWCLSTSNHYLDRLEGPPKLAIGTKLTNGLGTGGDPEIGIQAVDESYSDLKQIFQNADLVMILAGLGGGTGSGAGPRVAEYAKQAGIDVVAIVTQPFEWESEYRIINSVKAIERFQMFAKSLVVISHDEAMESGRQKDSNFTWDDGLDRADAIIDEAVTTVLESVKVMSCPGPDKRPAITKTLLSLALLPL